jgi:hypothetical protein
MMLVCWFTGLLCAGEDDEISRGLCRFTLVLLVTSIIAFTGVFSNTKRAYTISTAVKIADRSGSLPFDVSTAC